MNDADRLIYEKSNTYRLHADKLKWTLLGGYGAFFAAAASLLSPDISSPGVQDVAVNLLLFVFSVLFLIALAVQNWFYNLFSKFVKECEGRLVKNERLRSLEDFAVDQGKYVNPFHPSFFFAELVVGVTSFYFLFASLYSSILLFIGKSIDTFPIWLKILFVLGLLLVLLILFVVYFWILNVVLFRQWDKYIYRRLIIPFSNLWQPIPGKYVEKSKNADQ